MLAILRKPKIIKTISNKLRDFSGQNIYVGMDVHHKSWKVHIFSDEFELKSFCQEPDVDRLCNYLQTNIIKPVAYARKINNDPAAKKRYLKKVKTGQSVYHFAIQEYLKKNI